MPASSQCHPLPPALPVRFIAGHPILARDAAGVRRFLPLWPVASFALLLAGCSVGKPILRGGGATTTLGGAFAPSSVTSIAPENSATPSTTTVEKIVTRDFAPGPLTSTGARSVPPPPFAGVENSTNVLTAAPASATPFPSVVANPFTANTASPSAVAYPSAPLLLREIVSERATTQTGVAQRDTSRELAARLASTRGVMWVGLLLLVAGPVVAIRLGWPLNGAIAAATGLLLIVLAQVLPGHEAWFGLGLLLLIPVVCFVYYRGHYDNPPQPPASS